MIKFWNGGEFKNSAAPCLELHTKNYRYRLLVIRKYPRFGVVLCYKEKL